MQPARGKVVIINQTLADKLFPDEDPIGKRIAWTGEILRFTPISADWRTIVGVVGNTQDGGLDAAPRPGVFMPFAQELGDRRRAGDPRRQQRGGAGGGGDAHRAAHRADGADRERDDDRADQGSERLAAAAERGAHRRRSASWR